MKKRMLVLLCVLTLLVAALPVSVSAAKVASGTCGENLTWVLDEDGLLTISGEGAMDDYNGDAPWYSIREQITAIVIESGVTTIGEGAFVACTNAESITISESVALIGEGPFIGCIGLKGIWVHEENPNYSSDSCGMLFNKEQTLLIWCPQGFEGDYIIPDSVIALGNNAFHNSDYLTGVFIPSGITRISTGAIMMCNALKDVTISEGVEVIGQEALAYCDALEKILLPSTITTIEDSAFIWDKALTEIWFAGDAPEFSEIVFTLVTANAYYPGNNETWTEDVMQDYDGTLTWIPYCTDCGQSYDSVVTAPTCTEAGHTTYTCACGDAYTDDIVPATGHTFEVCAGEDPTCTEDGVVEYACVNCWDTSVTYREVIPATGHSWDDGVITKEATKEEEGILTYTCEICGETKTEEYEYSSSDDEETPESGVTRVYGSNRCETAIAAADEMKAILGVETFDTIILASGDNFADALSGSYLAAVKGAPILLYRASGMELNLSYIEENLTEGGTVYILGGTAAVPADVEEALAGYNVARLFGDTRYDTNLAILEEAGVGDKEILVCTGSNFADSLSASATGLPILMVNNGKEELTENQIAFLENLEGNSFTIIGGTAAVSDTLKSAIEAYGETERVYGETREETSVLVAECYFENPAYVLLAYSRNFPDGLCGGPLAYALGAPLILTNAGAETAAAEYVAEKGITRGLVLGGTAVLTDETVNAVFAK